MLLSHHQKSFLLKQIRTNTDSHPDKTQRMRALGTFSTKWDASIKFPSSTSGLREPSERGGRKV